MKTTIGKCEACAIVAHLIQMGHININNNNDNNNVVVVIIMIKYHKPKWKM